MSSLLVALVALVASSFRTRIAPQAENLALRHHWRFSKRTRRLACASTAATGISSRAEPAEARMGDQHRTGAVLRQGVRRRARGCRTAAATSAAVEVLGRIQRIVSDRSTYAQSQVLPNPQTDPQNAMSCTTCMYLGNLHVLVSRCKT